LILAQGRPVVLISRELYALLKVWTRPADVPRVRR
jgi:hypothetical protein